MMNDYHRRIVCIAALIVIWYGPPIMGQEADSVRPPMDDLIVNAVGGDFSLSYRGRTTIRSTKDPIRNERLIRMSGGPAWIALWEEVQPSRQNQSFYRVSPDGQSLSRVRQTTYTIRVRYANFDPLADGEPAVAPELAAPASSNLYLVQFFAPPLEEMRQAIRALGGDVVRYMADHTHVVRMSAEARDQVAQLSYVRWVGPFHVAYKLSESIRSAFAVGLPESGTDRYSIEAFGRGPAEQEAVKALIEQAGGQVHFITKLGFRMEATLTPAQLLSVVRMNEVHYVHRWKLEDPEDMDIVRQISGTNFVEGATGFSGEGVRGESFDSGFQINHQDFTPTPIWRSAIGTESHGTATYGVMFGTGFGNAQARGICPDLEQGFVTRYQVTTQFGGAITRHSLYQAAVDPFGTVRIVNSTSSVGPYRTFFYDSISAEVDDYLFLYDLLSCQSMSNAGLIQDVRPQAWAKNIIGVGGITHGNSLSRADDFSSGSTGPAEDGRIKPDLAHFYDNVTTTYSTSTTGYGTFSGTSNATPCTCGHAALFFQMWHEGVWMGRGGQANVFDSRAKMATAKAAMVNTAFRYDWNSGGPNGNMWRTRQGWGMVNVQTLYERRNETFIVDEEDLLLPFQTVGYQIQVNPGGPPLNITMVYTDLMGPTSASQHRINDLSLKVTAPDNTVYWGNNGLLAGNWSTPGGVSNTVDTVENVFIQNPTPGTWVVEVLGDEIVQDSHPETPALDADFSLVVTGGLGSRCSSEGLIRLGSAEYGCTSTAVVQVVDCDLNTDDNVVETATATLESNTEPGGETLTLTETGPATADFRGSIPLSLTNSAGVLQVSPGDTLTATYIDADNGMGGINVVVTKTASLDCVGPVISNVVVQTVGADRATITFDTDEPAVGTIHVGTDCTMLTLTSTGTIATTSHTLEITGLASNTSYFLAVEAVDEQGNPTFDDNMGNCYTFSTPFVIFADNFETNQGWTAINLGATSGDWQRGVPVNDPGWAYDPISDSDGSGRCFVTQNQIGNTDVDNGAVQLVSPTLDFSGGAVAISYDYFLRLTNTTGAVDRLLVEINSNNGAGPWTQIALHTTDGGLNWRNHVITQADLGAAGVVNTATMRMRFTANDDNPQSINESGLDAVVITCSTCLPSCPNMLGDMNGDNLHNGVDVVGFVDAMVGAFNPCADLSAPFGILDTLDTIAFVNLLVGP